MSISVLQVLEGLLIPIACFIFTLCLNFVVTFIVCKIFKKDRFILKGVLVGGILGIIVLIYLWYGMLTDKPGGEAYEGAGFIMILLGQPLSWIAGFVEATVFSTWLQQKHNVYVTLVPLSVTFLLDWCGLGAFAGWLLQRKAGWRARKGMKENEGGKSHHNI